MTSPFHWNTGADSIAVAMQRKASSAAAASDTVARKRAEGTDISYLGDLSKKTPVVKRDIAKFTKAKLKLQQFGQIRAIK